MADSLSPTVSVCMTTCQISEGQGWKGDDQFVLRATAATGVEEMTLYIGMCLQSVSECDTH